MGYIEDKWSWDLVHRSTEAIPFDNTVLFHPIQSRGTAGIRGSRILNNGKFYWELKMVDRVFGTSIMFGIGTKEASLHSDIFKNLLGQDIHSWGLSHKGFLFHDEEVYRYTKSFENHKPVTVGILFDGIRGTLTYYIDNRCLGIAFDGLEKIKEPLYPIICSTVAETTISLGKTKRYLKNLQDLCCVEIVKRIVKKSDLDELQIPRYHIWKMKKIL